MIQRGRVRGFLFGTDLSTSITHTYISTLKCMFTDLTGISF